jgi:hypothetical protein
LERAAKGREKEKEKEGKARGLLAEYLRRGSSASEGASRTRRRNRGAAEARIPSYSRRSQSRHRKFYSDIPRKRLRRWVFVATDFNHIHFCVSLIFFQSSFPQASGATTISLKKRSIMDRLGDSSAQKGQNSSQAAAAGTTAKAGKGAAQGGNAKKISTAKLPSQKDTSSDAAVEVLSFAEIMRRKREAAGQAAPASAPPPAKRSKGDAAATTAAVAETAEASATAAAEAEAEIEKALAEEEEEEDAAPALKVESVATTEAAASETFEVDQRVIAQWSGTDDW